MLNISYLSSVSKKERLAQRFMLFVNMVTSIEVRKMRVYTEFIILPPRNPNMVH